MQPNYLTPEIINGKSVRLKGSFRWIMLTLLSWLMFNSSVNAKGISSVSNSFFRSWSEQEPVNKSCIINGPVLVCPGEQIVYSASFSSTANTTYSWSIDGDASITGPTNESNISVLVSAAGSFTITLEIMDSSSCGESIIACELFVSINSDPSLNAGPDQSVCIEGESAQFFLSGFVSAGTATWSVISGTAVITDPHSLTSSVIVSSSSATLRLTSDSPLLCGSCKAFAHDEVVLTVNPGPDCIIGTLNPADLVCNGGVYTISTPLDPALYDFEWTISVDGNPDGWEIIGSDSEQTLAFSAGDCGPLGFQVTVFLQVTDEATGCMSECEASFSPRAPLCVVDIRPPVELNCLVTSQYLLAVYSTDIINPVFEWTRNGVSLGEGINDGIGSDSILITEGGTYRFTITDPGNSANTCSAEVEVNENGDAPECFISGDAPDCLDLTHMYSGPVAPEGIVYIYEWTVTGDAVIEGANNELSVTVTATDNCESGFTLFLSVTDLENNCVAVCQAFFAFADTTAPVIGSPGPDITIICPETPLFTAPEATDNCDPDPEIISAGIDSVENNDGSITYTQTWHAADECGNISAEIEQTIIVLPCGDIQYCTQTQGFYGSGEGVTCVTGERGDDLIDRILDEPFGDLVIGKPGRMLTIDHDHAECIMELLPGGGTPAMLPEGNHTLDEECEIVSEESFMNVLAGQTIALGLNMRLDSDLGSLALEGELMFVSGSENGEDELCGNADDVAAGGESTVSFSSAVLNALDVLYGSRTVENLFDLGNRALGGLSTGGATLSEINDAITTINQTFLNCSFVEGFSDDESGSIASDLNGKAFPNPFRDEISIEFIPQKDGVATVEIFDLNGSKVATVFQGEVQGGERKLLKYASTGLPAGIYTYAITAGGKSFREKIILIK